MSGAWVYILECADGSYYTGLTKQVEPKARVWEHNNKTYREAYTSTRLPVRLIHAEHFELITDAIETERKLKKWNRAKKEAYMNGNWSKLQKLAKRHGSKA